MLNFELFDSFDETFSNCYNEERFVFGIPFVPEAAQIVPYDPSDYLSHGNIVNGLICANKVVAGHRIGGIAPASQTFVYRDLEAESSISHWFPDTNIKVATNSLGNEEGANSVAQYWEELGANASTILFIQSIGNSGTANTYADRAHDERVMAIAGARYDMADLISASSYGTESDPRTWPSLTAPGCVYAYTGYKAQPWLEYWELLAEPGNCPPEISGSTEAGIVRAQGTSVSAPIVAAAAALVFEVNPSLKPVEARYILEQTSDNFLPAEDLDGDGVVSKVEYFNQTGWRGGWGFVNATAAVAASHYYGLFGNSIDEAIACSHTGFIENSFWLNPNGECQTQSTPGDKTPINQTETSKANESKLDSDPTNNSAVETPLIQFPIIVGLLVLAHFGQRRKPNN